MYVCCGAHVLPVRHHVVRRERRGGKWGRGEVLEGVRLRKIHEETRVWTGAPEAMRWLAQQVRSLATEP